ncbi:preprotein translocase subunit SecE [Cumulibacter manganitolerans]|uniref:preprotein translocase subunit SecE n=1 Tax=Cumulibacter manganitolerans TaxID=1884992 RepID=UPI0012955925|nr:preprotein translocase subunit SecE [Cumulibacter manganitolerans]
MAKDSQRDSSSDDERELDNVADGTDDRGADDEDAALLEEDLHEDEDDLDEDDVDLDEDDLDDEVAAGGSTKRGRAAAAASARKKDAPTAKREAKPKTKSAVPGAAPGSFLQQVGNELSKVVWPTRKQMITYTSVVLVFVVALVAAVWGFDLGVGKLMDWIFA